MCGYYTVPLNKPVTVRHGETFAVVITLSSRNSTTIRYFTDESYVNGSWIRFLSSVSPGQSFAADASGSWTDLAREAAARIKAYTSELGSRIRDIGWSIIGRKHRLYPVFHDGRMWYKLGIHKFRKV